MGLRYLCTKVTRSAAIAASSNVYIETDGYSVRWVRILCFLGNSSFCSFCRGRRWCRR